MILFCYEKGLHKTHNLIVNNSETVERKDIFSQIKKLIDRFLGLEMKGRLGYNRVTPYMHTLLYHVLLFLDKCYGLGAFSGQGVK